MSLYCQQVLGYSALVSGLVALPQGIGGLLRGVLGLSIVAVDASPHTSTAQLGDGYRLALGCAAGLAAAATLLSLRLQGGRVTHEQVERVRPLTCGFGVPLAGPRESA